MQEQRGQRHCLEPGLPQSTPRILIRAGISNVKEFGLNRTLGFNSRPVSHTVFMITSINQHNLWIADLFCSFINDWNLRVFGCLV